MCLQFTGMIQDGMIALQRLYGYKSIEQKKLCENLQCNGAILKWPLYYIVYSFVFWVISELCFDCTQRDRPLAGSLLFAWMGLAFNVESGFVVMYFSSSKVTSVRVHKQWKHKQLSLKWHERHCKNYEKIQSAQARPNKERFIQVVCLFMFMLIYEMTQWDD